MELPEVEEAKQKSIRAIEYLPPFKKGDEEVEPWILIDRKDGKVRVLVNRSKCYRVLAQKNVIQQSLDILLVDTIKEMLNGLAKQEESFEKDMKEMGGKGNGNNVPKSGRSGSPFRGSGQSGDTPSDSRDSDRFV